MIEVLITSSALILILAVLRAIFRKRIRAGIQYALWGLMARGCSAFWHPISH